MSRDTLAGFTIGVTADRRAEEQAHLLRRRGAEVVAGPSIRTHPLTPDDGLGRATEAIIAAPPDVVVLTTGIGVRSWLAGAESLGLGEPLLAALAGAYVVARGPKAVGAAVTAGLPVAWAAPTEQSAEIVAHLAQRTQPGQRVAVQLDGRLASPLDDALRRQGAEVLDVPVYRWTLPEHPAPAQRLIDAAIAGRLDAVTFTSAPALDNLFALAVPAGRQESLRRSLSGPVACACVGPVCARAARDHGLAVAAEPRRARLGAMVEALAQLLSDRRRTVLVDGLEVVLQGRMVLAGEGAVAVTHQERALLDALARRPGQVVAKLRLGRLAWSTGQPGVHTVEVTVARLRRRLGPVGLDVQSVSRRGYRLVARPPPPVHAATEPVSPCTGVVASRR